MTDRIAIADYANHDRLGMVNPERFRFALLATRARCSTQT
jgi:hypothetical protein